MNITDGQHNDIIKRFADYNKDKSSIIAEGGNDNGQTFNGTFLVKIYRKGTYKFKDGILIKKII